MKQYKFSESQRLLIKPSKRLQFTLLYIFVTVISYELIQLLLGYFIADSTAYPYQFAAISGLMLGGLVGLSQWLVLRKYIPNPQWIFVVVAYQSLLSVSGTLLSSKFSQLFSERLNSEPPNLTLFTISCYSYLIFGTFLYGYGQHYVIAPYIRKFRWWLWISLSSLVLQCVIFGWISLSSMVAASATSPVSAASAAFYINLLRFDYRFLLSAGIALFQTIGFCYLYKKSSKDEFEDPTLDPNFNLTVAPDLVDFWKIRSIQQTIEKRINKIWKTDLVGDEDLAYLIGVDQSGEIVACVPQTQTAIDRFQETPLPALGQELAQESSSILNQPIAKFNLTFSPPGISKLVSCRGIPRRGLFGTIALIIVIVSMIIPRLGTS
jgi:hypothetical protein